MLSILVTTEIISIIVAIKLTQIVDMPTHVPDTAGD